MYSNAEGSHLWCFIITIIIINYYYYFQDIEYLKVDLLDTPEQDFLSQYPIFEQFIDQGRAKGKVLVHW